MPDRRRAGLLVLLVLLAGALPLVVPPFDLGALRLAGVNLLWWYVGAVAPVVAVLATVIALGSSGGVLAAPHGQTPGRGSAAEAGSGGASDRERSATVERSLVATVSAPDAR